MREYVRVAAVVVGAFVALAAAGAAAAPPSAGPVTIAQWHGGLGGVAQDARHIAWCDGTGVRIRTLTPPSEHNVPANCPTQTFQMGFAREGIGWGGYEDVRNRHTSWAVYGLAGGRTRRVTFARELWPGSGRDLVGVVSDGTSVFYAELRVVCDESEDCSSAWDKRTTFRIAGGGVYRIVNGRRIAAQGIPPTAEIAASDGRVATVEPEPTGQYYAGGDAGVDFPRAAANAVVEVRRSRDGEVLTQVMPVGIVRALALTPRYLVTLVESNRALRIEWYDAVSGTRLGASPVVLPSAWWWKISASGHYVAFTGGRAIRVLDLHTGRQRILWRATGYLAPVEPIVSGNRVVWGHSGVNNDSRVFAVTLP